MRIALAFFVLALSAIGQDADFRRQIRSTTFTRDLLEAATAAQARAKLGVANQVTASLIESNWTSLYNYTGATNNQSIQVLDRGGNVWSFVSGATETNLAEPAVNGGVWKLQNWNGDVRAFGVVGDGIADDTAALQSALSYGGNPEKIFLPPGKTSYITASLLSTRPFTRFEGYGATILTTNCDYFLRVSNAIPSGYYPITADVTLGTNAIATSYTNLAGLTTNAWIQIRDSKIRGTNVNNGRNIDKNQVKDIGYGYIKLQHAITADFFVSRTAEFTVIPAADAIVRGFTIINLNTNEPSLGGVGGGIYGSDLTSALIEDNKIYRPWNACVQLDRSTFVKVLNNTLGGASRHDMSGMGYGYRMLDSTHRFEIAGNHTSFIRENGLGAGACYGKIHHNYVSGGGVGLDTHGNEVYEIEFSNNDVIGQFNLGLNISFTTANTNDYNITVRGNRFITDGRCIGIGTPPTATNRNIIIADNLLRSGYGPALHIRSYTDGLIIEGNQFMQSGRDSAAYPIHMEAGTATIRNNYFYRPSTIPILLSALSYGCVIEGNHFEDNGSCTTGPLIYTIGNSNKIRSNFFKNFTVDGIYLHYSTIDNYVSGNFFENFRPGSNSVIRIDGGNHVVENTTIHDSEARGIYVSQYASNTVVRGVFGKNMTNDLVYLAKDAERVQIDAVTGSGLGGYGIYASGVSNVSISGFRFKDSTNAIYIASSSNIRLANGEIEMNSAEVDQTAIRLALVTNVVLRGINVDGSHVKSNALASLAFWLNATDLDASDLTVDPVGNLRYGFLVQGDRMRFRNPIARNQANPGGTIRMFSISTGSDDITIDGGAFVGAGFSSTYPLRHDGGVRWNVRNTMFTGNYRQDISSGSVVTDAVFSNNDHLSKTNATDAILMSAGSTWVERFNRYTGSDGFLTLVESQNPTGVSSNVGLAGIHLTRSGTNQVLVIVWESGATNVIATQP